MSKPHIDSIKKESYRSIFLINMDAKILANLIQKHIKMIIYHVKAGFVLEIHRWFNIRKSVSVIYHIKKLKEK